MSTNEYKHCPYCGRTYTGGGFHGYCGRKCAIEEQGQEWVNKKLKSDNILGAIFIVVIIVVFLYYQL